MEKRKLQELIIEHKEKALSSESFFPRDIESFSRQFFNQKEAHIITGVRRCGKSTLMRLLMKRLLQEEAAYGSNILYLNFEDDRFAEFNTTDFQTLYEAFLEIESPKGKKYFFLDEVQNIPDWHRWVNRLYEFEDIKIFITGSNGSILSGEIATALSGRNRIIELYPFSFKEFLSAKGFVVGKRDFLIAEKRAAIKRLFNEYLDTGGFPEVIKNKDTELLQNYFKDTIYRDVVARYSIRNIREIKELSLFLAAHLSCAISYKRLKDMIAVNSANTVKNYLGYLEDVYLFFKVDLFDYSLKRQIYNPSKIYCVDHALSNSIAFKFSSDIGRTIGNIVYTELRRRGCDVYYWKGKNGSEADFLIKKGTTIEETIQVSYNIDEKKTIKREIRGAVAAAKQFELKSAKIITGDNLGEERVEDITINYIPVWQWLLEKLQ